MVGGVGWRRRGGARATSSMNKGRGEQDKWSAMKDLEVQKQRDRVKRGGRTPSEERCDTATRNVIIIRLCGTAEKYQPTTAAGGEEDLIFRHFRFILTLSHTHTQHTHTGDFLWPVSHFLSLIQVTDHICQLGYFILKIPSF